MCVSSVWGLPAAPKIKGRQTGGGFPIWTCHSFFVLFLSFFDGAGTTPIPARWGGGLPREGVVAKKFVPSLESLSSLGFEERNLGCPGNFAGMSGTPGGVQKVFAKKSLCAFFVPYIDSAGTTPIPIK